MRRVRLNLYDSIFAREKVAPFDGCVSRLGKHRELGEQLKPGELRVCLRLQILKQPSFECMAQRRRLRHIEGCDGAVDSGAIDVVIDANVDVVIEIKAEPCEYAHANDASKPCSI